MGNDIQKVEPSTTFTKRSTFRRSIMVYFLILFSLHHSGYTQTAPVQEWFKIYNANSRDEITSWVETTDGYLLGGSSLSGIGGDKSEASRGSDDYWIIKIDKAGNKVWDKTFGGTNVDLLSTILATPDGFLLCGTSRSAVGGDKTQTNRYISSQDYWVVKITKSGTKVWDKTFGSTREDILAGAVNTPDGGFLLYGSSNSPKAWEKSEDVRKASTDATSNNDYWLVKINSSGGKVWDKTFGGGNNGSDAVASAVATPDGGFLVVGVSGSAVGFDKTDYKTGYNNWLLKLNSLGTKVWDKSYGNPGDEEVISDIFYGEKIVLCGSRKRPTSDGGYIPDIIFKQIDAQGNLILEKTEKILESEDGQGAYVNAFGQANNGISVVYQTYKGPLQTGRINYVAKYNWDLVNQYKKPIGEAEPGYLFSFIKYNSQGEAFIGYRGGQYGLMKLSAEGVVQNGKIIEAENNYSVRNEAGTRAIGKVNHSSLSGASSVKIWDTGDKIRIQFNAQSGQYIIKVRVRSGYYVSETKYDVDSYWPNGYSFWLNGSSTSFIGDKTTIFEKSDAYGGSYWGTMNSQVISLNAGINSLDIMANLQWGGVDYIEIVPSVSSFRLADSEFIKIYRSEVYPNPFKSLLNIKLSEAITENATILLTDRFGKTILRKSMELNGENSISLDLSSINIKSGLYFIKVRTSKGESIVRVVKE